MGQKALRKISKSTPRTKAKSPRKNSAAGKKAGSSPSKNPSATKLLIVESPAKVRTIKKFLGSDFNIVASRGHVRDLLKTGERKMGIDVHGDFQGEYGEIPTKKKAISELRRAASTADEIYLAPDPDGKARPSPGTFRKSSAMMENTARYLGFRSMKSLHALSENLWKIPDESIRIKSMPRRRAAN